MRARVPMVGTNVMLEFALKPPGSVTVLVGATTPNATPTYGSSPWNERSPVSRSAMPRSADTSFWAIGPVIRGVAGFEGSITLRWLLITANVAHSSSQLDG